MNRIFFNIKEALKSIIRNKNTSIATMISMSVTLLILGIILIIVLNINNFVVTAKGEFSGVQIFIKNSATKQQEIKLKEQLEQNEKIQKVDFVSKQETFKNFIDKLDDDKTLFDDIDNPCEDSFVIKLKNAEDTENIVEIMEKDDRVSSVSYYQDIIKSLIKISKIVNLASLLIITVLFALSIFIMENTIKIAIFSRMREISIMKYIGATNWFIRWPFLIEGALIGFLGSMISYSFLKFIYQKTFLHFSSSLFSKYIIDSYTLNNVFFSLFVTVGVGIGMLGSIISLRKYLKV